MSDHSSIQKIAALSFAEHVLTKGPARSWRMGKPGHGAYAFRVTWGPGVLTISGDVGRAVYEVWPGLATVWDAVDFVERAGFDYLCEKSGFTREFDRDATVSHLIEMAYADLRCGSRSSFFRQVCEEYGGDADLPCDRKEAARAFRDDHDLTAERVYNITGDFEASSYSFPSDARWAYEAAKLWARTMRASEPRWHRLWRQLQREASATKRAWRSTKHFRPELYAAPRGFGHDTLWVRRTYVHDGRDRARMASVAPLRLFGVWFSWAGLWRETGSSWPLGKDARDAQFVPVRDGGACGMTMPTPDLRDDVHAVLDAIWLNAADTGGYAGRAQHFLRGKGLRNAQRIARDRTYAWLAEQMWLLPKDCHVTRFTVDQCLEAICLLHGTSYAEIRAWAKAREAGWARDAYVERRAA